MKNIKNINPVYMKKIYFVLALFMLVNPAFSQIELEKNYDVKQYILDLQINNNSTVVSGNVIINSVVTSASIDTFAIELIDTIVAYQTFMVVDSVFKNGIKCTFIHKNDLILIPFTDAVLNGQMFSVQIYYHGKAMPVSQTNGNGVSQYNYSGKIHTCTFSEPSWSKVWWPCKQVLADKADSVTFFITTDSLNKSGSNGILKATENLPNGKVKYKWETKYPTAYYLVSFVVGPLDEYITYAKLPNGQDSVLLQNLLFENSPLYAQHLKVIEKTKELIYLFSDLLGDYPFKNEKYGYAVIGSPLGAMEHQTMCTIGYNAMDTTSNDYYSYYFWYVAHELAHQWFGD